MSDMMRIYGMLQRGMDSLLDLWPIKLLISAVTGVWCWLFDGTGAIFAAVVGFVVLDTLTKWAAITKRYLIDNGTDPVRITLVVLFCGFWCAWKPGYLSSTELRKCWGDKLFTYLVLIIAAGLVAKLPDITLFGLPVNRSIIGGIYAFIAITELFSITENFEEMGNTQIGQLKQFLCTLVTKITGSNFSVTMSSAPRVTNKDGDG